jgi:FixJ family two-component response regulator
MAESAGTVIVVDDDPGLRDALESLLSSVGLEVRLYESAAEFRAASLPDGPCCVVLDVRLPGRSGLDLQSDMIRDKGAPPIIFITGHGDIPMTVRAMKSGAVEFLPKPFRDQELLDAVYTALDRDRARRAEEAAAANLRARLTALSQREREVMDLVLAGRPNKQIAASLALSEITVKVHRGRMMRKMQARSVAELVRMAERLGVTAAGA